jgi:hypothetical protein
MKRSARYLLVCCLILAVLPVLAARPLQLGVQGSIKYPEANATVRGLVAILGSAGGSNFQFYKVEWTRSADSADWHLIGTTYPVPVTDGVLVQWDTTTVPDGVYTLRLRVVKTDGNYLEYFVPQVVVANKRPTETPTPSPTPEDVAGPTATPGPTATLAIVQPSVALAQPSPTPTPVRPLPGTAMPRLPVIAWREALCMGAGTMAAIFAVLGAVLALRRIL